MSVLASWWACLVHISRGCYAMPHPIKEGFRAMANGVSSSQHDSGRRVSWAGIGKGNQVELQRALPCLATFEMTCQLCLSWKPVADWLDESSIMYKKLQVGPGLSIGSGSLSSPTKSVESLGHLHSTKSCLCRRQCLRISFFFFFLGHRAQGNICDGFVS